MTSAIGSITQNRPCHGRICSSAPETVGPTAGATDITIEMRPMMRPRSCGATIVMTVVIISGIMMAVPMAWTTRPTISISKTGESAAMSVPTLNVTIATMKTGRVFRRCSSHPVVGMTTAMVRANAVVSHWPWVASMRSASWILGSATVIIVSLRKTTNTAASSRISAVRLRRAIASSVMIDPVGVVFNVMGFRSARCLVVAPRHCEHCPHIVARASDNASRGRARLFPGQRFSGVMSA